jgi:hypothetical protein
MIEIDNIYRYCSPFVEAPRTANFQYGIKNLRDGNCLSSGTRKDDPSSAGRCPCRGTKYLCILRNPRNTLQKNHENLPKEGMGKEATSSLLNYNHINQISYRH